MFPGYVQQPDFIGEAAYRKGYARGLAASEPSRMITVNVNITGRPPNTPEIPSRITFSMRQDTPMRDVLAEIHGRLPKMEYPISVTTVGAGAEQLTSVTDDELMTFLNPWDASFLNMRLDVKGPRPVEPPKKSTGSRLRKALGFGKAHKDDSSDVRRAGQTGTTGRLPSPSSMRSAPPPYEEAARPLR